MKYRRVPTVTPSLAQQPFQDYFDFQLLNYYFLFILSVLQLTPQSTMSIQMTLVFVTLCIEMAILFLFVLPLPHAVRRKLITVIDLLRNLNNFKIGLGFFTAVLALQFIDCANRLQRLDYLKNPYFTTSNNSSSSMLTNDQLAAKFFSQRNLYLSGAVLYLELSIYTVGTILRKLVSKEENLRQLNVKPEFASAGEEASKYKELISKKQQDIDTLKKQVDGLQKSYDGLTPSETRSKDD